MYLLGRNARLTLIQSPAVPADPAKGISGTAASTRWSGSVDAYIDEDLTDQIKAQQRYHIGAILVDVPVNLPVWPQLEDVLTLQRINVLQPYATQAAPQTETLIARGLDGGFVMLGKLRVIAVRS